jgi:hypothetical protein
VFLVAFGTEQLAPPALHVRELVGEDLARERDLLLEQRLSKKLAETGTAGDVDAAERNARQGRSLCGDTCSCTALTYIGGSILKRRGVGWLTLVIP